MGLQAQAGLRAVHVGAANKETQLQTVDQDMADAEADQDMADVAVVEHPHLHEDEEHVRSTRSGNILKRDTSMKKTEHRWIQSRSERVSSASWQSWMSWELVNRATVHGRDRCGQRDGVAGEEVMPFAVGSWFDSSEKEQSPVCTRVQGCC